MTPDPRWLEILKASGWQTTALAFAFGIFWLLYRSSTALPAWSIPIDVFCFLICASLALGSVGHAAAKFLQPKTWLAEWIFEKWQRKDVREYIPFMTDREKKIISYLLAKNQKVITAAQDGGYAVTLISRGILRRSMRPGQAATVEDMPFVIPDHVWDELAKHRDAFPYTPPNMRDGAEPHPWRVPWQLR